MNIIELARQKAAARTQAEIEEMRQEKIKERNLQDRLKLCMAKYYQDYIFPFCKEQDFDTCYNKTNNFIKILYKKMR